MGAPAIQTEFTPVQFQKLTVIRKRRSRLKRLSPFILLVGFITAIWIPYILITGTASLLQFILIPVIIAYTVFGDFFIWNLFEGKRVGLIWIIESFISAFVIYWLI